MLQNLTSLQAQNDEQADQIDELKKSTATLKKDLEASIASAMESKEKLEQTSSELNALKLSHKALETEAESQRKEKDILQETVQAQGKGIESLTAEKERLAKEHESLSKK